MNTHIARALVKDAFYQVLDNTVFRVLVITAIVMVAPTFLIAFKPDHIDVLFGAWTFPYPGGGTAPGGDVHVRVIQGLQSLFVEGLAGGLGTMFCLAATAFFVPRMLEKGEADTLFSKPVGRFVLLLARYAAGVLFVAALAFLLVLGMHVGLLVRSGYSDPGFLWGALTLVYVFALIHAFSTLMGVMTRSAVAALLLAILFFWANGALHGVWVWNEHRAEKNRIQSVNVEDDAAPAAKDQDDPWVTTLIAVLDGLHYALPKTNDADVLTRKLRQAVTGDPFVVVDTNHQLSVEHAPDDLVREGSGRDVDLSKAPVVWSAQENGRTVARVTLARHSRVVEKKFGEKTRTSRTSAASASSAFLKTMEASPEVDGHATREHVADEGAVRDRVTWMEKRASGAVERQRAFLAVGDWMYEIDGEIDATWSARAGHEDVLATFLRGLKPERDSAAELSSSEWYEKQFGWTAPLRFNAFFSLATSILFAVFMLLIARWRLERIDF